MSLTRLLLLGSLILLITQSLPAHASTSSEDWLHAQQWQRRLVIVDAALAPSLEAVLPRYEAALRERRVAVWRWDGDSLDWIGGMPSLGAVEASGPTIVGLRQALDRAPVRPGLHLFGLDGGLKASEAQAEQLQTLIEAVDSMPMRVRELRRDAEGSE